MVREAETGPAKNLLRNAEFWQRASGVYLAYKGAQMKAAYLKARGWDAAQLREKHWLPHHSWSGDPPTVAALLSCIERAGYNRSATAACAARRAGREFYSMAVDLRGFYLKVKDCTGPELCIAPATWQPDSQSPCMQRAAGPILCCAGRVCAGAHLPPALPAA